MNKGLWALSTISSSASRGWSGNAAVEVLQVLRAQVRKFSVRIFIVAADVRNRVHPRTVAKYFAPCPVALGCCVAASNGEVLFALKIMWGSTTAKVFELVYIDGRGHFFTCLTTRVTSTIPI